MFEHTQALDNEPTPESSMRRIGARRFLSESGVHAKLALAIESFGKTEWDDETDNEQEVVTLVRLPVQSVPSATMPETVDELDADELTVPFSIGHSRAATRTRLARTPRQVSVIEQAVHPEVEPEVEPLSGDDAPASGSLFQAPNAAWYQVALQLRDAELAQLWARHAAALQGRAFVWSEQRQSWCAMGVAHESLGVRASDSIAASSGAHPQPKSIAKRAYEVAAASLATPVDWAFLALGAAAALALILCLSRLSEYAAQPATHFDVDRSVRSTSTRLPREMGASAKYGSSHAESAGVPEIVPVTALPLVSKASQPNRRIRG